MQNPSSLSQLSHAEKDALILMKQGQVTALQEAVKQLQSRLNMSSRNSSKSTLDNFQRTRGVLKLMAKVIHRLWKDNDKDPLIMPGSFPLQDAETRNDLIYYLPQGWDPVVERDVDGERAETTEIENRDTRLDSVQACRRAAGTIFLGNAPTTANQMASGIELERIMLSVGTEFAAEGCRGSHGRTVSSDTGSACADWHGRGRAWGGAAGQRRPIHP